MKKTTQIKSILFCLFLLLGSAGVSAQKIYYQEDFNTVGGTGGNSDGWKDKVANNALKDADIEKLKKGADGTSVWIFENGYKGSKCVKLGTAKKLGTATTPKLGLTGKAVLTFKAGAWDGTKENLNLKLEAIGGGSVNLTQVTLKKGEFTEYTVKITGGTANTQIKFSGEKKEDSRFFLDDVVVEEAPPETTVETPVFTPVGGEYFDTVEVEITCATDGATIRYTTDGTEPTETSAKYTTPIKITVATTIKAKAFKKDLVDSEVAEAAYSFAPSVATLTELRALEVGKKAVYTGMAAVSFLSKDRNAKYIQDATGAILIDDETGKILGDYKIGSKISQIKGTLTLFNGMLQFQPTEDASLQKGTEVVAPEELSLQNLTAEHEAKLVKVKNISFNAGEVTKFEKGKNVAITNSEVVVRSNYSDLDYIGESIPTVPQDIVAVVLVYNNTIQLVPRSKAEITAAATTGIQIPESSLTKLYSTEGQIHFEAKLGETVEIYNLLGQLIYKSNVSDGINTIELPKGVAIVKIGNSVKKVLVK